MILRSRTTKTFLSLRAETACQELGNFENFRCEDMIRGMYITYV